MENPYKDTKNTKHYVFWERANQRLSRQVNSHSQKGTRWVCICLGRLPTQLCLDMIVNPTSPTANTDLVNLKGTTYSIFTSWPFQFSQRLVSHTRGGGVKKARSHSLLVLTFLLQLFMRIKNLHIEESTFKSTTPESISDNV